MRESCIDEPPGRAGKAGPALTVHPEAANAIGRHFG
jgi:hypothetical protein